MLIRNVHRFYSMRWSKIYPFSNPLDRAFRRLIKRPFLRMATYLPCIFIVTFFFILPLAALNVKPHGYYHSSPKHAQLYDDLGLVD